MYMHCKRKVIFCCIEPNKKWKSLCCVMYFLGSFPLCVLIFTGVQIILLHLLLCGHSILNSSSAGDQISTLRKNMNRRIQVRSVFFFLVGFFLLAVLFFPFCCLYCVCYLCSLCYLCCRFQLC